MKVLDSHNLSVLYLITVFMALITLIIVGPYGVRAQTDATGNSTITQKTGVKITSPKINQIVPAGPLTIEGTSSDTPNTNCQVYVDWNDTKPMQNVTARGPGGPSDYSNWTFTYTHNYHLIMAGMNELTSKITCNHDSATINNVPTKFYSINITGTGNATNFNLPTNSSNLSSTGFYDARFTPLLPQYSNDSNQSYVAAANINTNSEAATYDNISDNTHLVKESSGDDSSSSSSSKEDNHDNHNSDNNDKSNSGDSTNNSNGNKKVEIHIAKHLKSTKFENIGHDNDKEKYKLNFKRHNDNTKSGDLHKYIHDLIKKKMKRVSDRIFG